jgi:hypothetical protein
MIDLLKQYVDGGADLSGHQIDKLPRSLFITFMRRVIIENSHILDNDMLVAIGKKIHYLTTKQINEFLSENPWGITYIPNATYEQKLSAVKEYGPAIQGIEKPTEELQLAAVTNNPNVIKYIKKPSKKVQLAAVSNIPSTIRHIENPSRNVQLVAVAKNGMTIRYIIEKGITPSEKVQLAAIENLASAIKYIENPYPSVIKLYNELTK